MIYIIFISVVIIALVYIWIGLEAVVKLKMDGSAQTIRIIETVVRPVLIRTEPTLFTEEHMREKDMVALRESVRREQIYKMVEMLDRAGAIEFIQDESWRLGYPEKRVYSILEYIPRKNG